MKRISHVLRNALTLGKAHQSFLDARWISLLLHLTPGRYKRAVALRILSLSPHYFYRKLQPASVRGRQFLDAEFERNRQSRRRIFETLIEPQITKDSVALDVGCGPGFLSRQVAERARYVYAADISSGVLACAQILNGQPNIRYVSAQTDPYAEVPRGGVDFVFSFAVVQHCTEEILQTILSQCHEKMRPGARGLFHLVIDDQEWTTEQDVAGDRSVLGRVKYRYGLNCFTRSKADVMRAFTDAGLRVIDIGRAGELANMAFDGDDIWAQDLVHFAKP